jgi:hypothetical protein
VSQDDSYGGTPPPGYGVRRPTNPLPIVALARTVLGALAPIGLALGIMGIFVLASIGNGGFAP